MSKAEIIWKWFIGLFLTLANLFLLLAYAITKDYSPYQIALAIIFLIYGIGTICEMICYHTSDK